MAFNTYANLKTAIGNWTRNAEVDKDEIIGLVEATMFNNEVAPLRVRELEVRATATATASSRYVALPTRFLDMRRLKLTSGGNEFDIRYRTPESLLIKGGTGRPLYFSILAQLEFDIAADSAYDLEMLYYQRPTALDATNTTNDVLTNYPNIYLFGCRWATYLYQNDAEAEATNYQRFLGAIRGANKTSKKARMGPAPAMVAERLTP